MNPGPIGPMPEASPGAMTIRQHAARKTRAATAALIGAQLRVVTLAAAQQAKATDSANTWPKTKYEKSAAPAALQSCVVDGFIDSPE